MPEKKHVATIKEPLTVFTSEPIHTIVMPIHADIIIESILDNILFSLVWNCGGISPPDGFIECRFDSLLFVVQLE